MTAEKTIFTPWRENGYTASAAAHDTYDTSLDKEHGIPFEEFLKFFDFEVWRDDIQRWKIAAARERDCDSLFGPYIRVPKNARGFERWGRRFTRMCELDVVAEAAGAPRGGAKDAKPDPEYRQFLKDWQKVQWAREDHWCNENEEPEIGGWDSAPDVPLRAVLGGMQDFTPLA